MGEEEEEIGGERDSHSAQHCYDYVYDLIYLSNSIESVPPDHQPLSQIPS